MLTALLAGPWPNLNYSSARKSKFKKGLLCSIPEIPVIFHGLLKVPFIFKNVIHLTKLDSQVHIADGFCSYDIAIDHYIFVYILHS